MDRDFYIFSDIDSTFEGDKESFENFNSAVCDLESEVGRVKIYFVSGTNSEDYLNRLNWFKENVPDIYNRIEGAVLSDGFIGKHDTSPVPIRSAYKEHDKIRACDYLLANIGPNFISGILYFGDSPEDVRGMSFIKNFDRYFEYGVSTVMPANSKYDMFFPAGVDYSSPYRRIEGCTDGIIKLSGTILKKGSNFAP